MVLHLNSIRNQIEVGSATDDTLTGEGYTGFLIAYANTPGYTVKVDALTIATSPDRNKLNLILS